MCDRVPRRVPAPEEDPATAADRAIRVAIVGGGWMAVAHLRAYAARPDVRIVGLVTRSSGRAAELADRFGIEATFDDVKTMLEAARPDGISVTTVEHEHVEPTCAALERGIGVLVEKPMATTIEGAERMVETAVRTGSPLVPAHILRFAAPHRALRREVVAGSLGRVLAIAARRDRTTAIAETYARVHPALLTAVHDIDQVLWLTGTRIVRVRALEVRRPDRPQPDGVWAQLELASGTIATVATAMLHPAGASIATSDRLEVYGTDGVAAIDMTQPLVSVHAEPATTLDWILEPPDGGGAFGEEIGHFLACLRSRRASDVIAPEEALHGVRVAHAIIRSASDGSVVTI
jgi:predicted dehydrogenase